MNFFCATVFAVSLALANSVSAGPATDELADCLTKQTNGQERIDLAIWVVLAYSQHPDVADVISTNGNPQDSADRELAELFSELLLERCPEEAKAAIKSDGNLAMEAAFQVLGQVAGQELANNPQVNSAMTGFTRYLDHKRLNTFFN